MELMSFLVEIFPTIGFPVICCAALGWFVYRFYTDSQRQNKENMEAVQARCQEREDKLYDFMREQQGINAGFANIIEKYNIKLEEIREDVSVIKTDVEILKNK